MLCLKSFGNWWANSYTKFVILDVKLRLTCGESDGTALKNYKVPKYYDHDCSYLCRAILYITVLYYTIPYYTYTILSCETKGHIMPVGSQSTT